MYHTLTILGGPKALRSSTSGPYHDYFIRGHALRSLLKLLFRLYIVYWLLSAGGSKKQSYLEDPTENEGSYVLFLCKVQTTVNTGCHIFLAKANTTH